MINFDKLFKISFLFGLFLSASSHSYAMDDDEGLARAIAAQKKREEELTRGFRAAQATHNTSQVTEEFDPELARALRLSAEEAEVEALAKQVQQEEESRKTQGTKQLSGDTLSEEDFQKYLQMSLGEAHPPTTTSQSYGKSINTEEPDPELAIALLLSQEQVQKKPTVQVNPDALSDEDLEKFLQSQENVVVPNTYRVNQPSSAERGSTSSTSTTVGLGDFLYNFETNKDRDEIWTQSRNRNEKQMKEMNMFPSTNTMTQEKKEKELEKQEKEIQEKRMKALEELERTKKEYEKQQVNEGTSQQTQQRDLFGDRSAERVAHNINKETERLLKGLQNLNNGKPWDFGRKDKKEEKKD